MTTYPYKWRHNGLTSWSDVYRWCYTNIGATGWSSSWTELEFEREEDLTLFLLRWA